VIRNLLCCATLVAALTSVSAGVGVAQTYPTRPVTLIAPFPPGAVTDSMARIVQSAVERQLGQPIVIDNQAGAGGVRGTNMTSRAQPDGYTLLLTVNAPVVMSPFIQANYPFDPKTGLSGVAKVAETYLSLAVQKKSPINSVADVVRLAKEKPGQMTFGSAGVGSAHQIAGELLNKNAGIKITHVPFQGGAPAIQNLVGGHIDMSYGTLAAVLPFVDAGELKLIALAEPKRIAEFPNLPTINETVPGVETTTWVGIFAPPGTPKAIRDRWYQLVSDALKTPEVIERMKALGLKVALQGPDDFDATIANDLGFWKTAIEKTGIEKH
jgi:tripartite-type tricarboxylate transporter receptor subunit TctC